MFIDEFNASNLLLEGITEISKKHGKKYVSTAFGISTQVTAYLLKLTTHDKVIFREKVEQRRAIRLNTNFPNILTLAKTIVDVQPGDTNEQLETSDPENINTLGSSCCLKLYLAKTLINHLSQSNHFDIGEKSQFSAYSTLVQLHQCISNMSRSQVCLLVSHIHLGDFITLHVDEFAIDLIVASLKSGADDRKLFFDLIEAGASYKFLKKYWVKRPITRGYFRDSKLSVKKTRPSQKVDEATVLELYFRLLSERRPILNVFLEMHKRLHVEICNMFAIIQKTLMDENHDDIHFEDNTVPPH